MPRTKFDKIIDTLLQIIGIIIIVAMFFTLLVNCESVAKKYNYYAKLNNLNNEKHEKK